MQKAKMTFVVLVGSLFLVLPALAGRPAQRMNRQQTRIYQGAKSGRLTRKETRKLERKQASTARMEARMRAKHGGHLTRKDRIRLQHRQNRTSRQIFRKKHNRNYRGR